MTFSYEASSFNLCPFFESIIQLYSALILKFTSLWLIAAHIFPVEQIYEDDPRCTRQRSVDAGGGSTLVQWQVASPGQQRGQVAPLARSQHV